MAEIDLSKYAAKPPIDLKKYAAIDLSKYAAAPGSDPDNPINEQHPDIGVLNRMGAMNVGTSSATVARKLETDGFEVKDRGNYNLSVRKPGGKWYVVDPKGFDVQDILDVGGDVASAIAMAAGAGIAGLAASPSGPGAIPAAVAGSAGGSAAAEAAKQGIGAALGYKPTLGESLGAIGREAAVGAGGELLGQGLKAGVGAIKAARGVRIPSEASASILGRESASKGALGTKAAGEAIPRTARESAINELNVVIDKNIAQNEALRQKFNYSEMSRWGDITNPVERAYAHKKADYLEVVGKRGVEPPDYMRTVAAQQGVSPGEYVAGKASSYPREGFAYQNPEKFIRNFLDKHEGKWGTIALKESAARAGYKNAWDLSTDELKNLLRDNVINKGDYKLLQDTLIDTAQSAWDKMGTFGEAIFPTNKGDIRQMIYSIVPPVTAKGIEKESVNETLGKSIRELVTDDILTNGISGARRSVLKAWGSRATSKVIKDVNKAETLDELTDLAFRSQKVAPGGKGFLTYNPKNARNRIVWDVDNGGFKTVPLDKLFRLSAIDPQTGKVVTYDFLKNPELLKPFGFAYQTGRALTKLGAIGQIPGKIAGKFSEAIGIPKEFGPLIRKLPYAGAITGGPIGKTLAGTQLTADMLQLIGRKLMHDDGTLIARIAKAPFNGAERIAKTLKNTLDKDGLAAYRATAYTIARSTPEMANYLLSP